MHVPPFFSADQWWSMIILSVASFMNHGPNITLFAQRPQGHIPVVFLSQVAMLHHSKHGAWQEDHFWMVGEVAGLQNLLAASGQWLKLSRLQPGKKTVIWSSSYIPGYTSKDQNKEEIYAWKYQLTSHKNSWSLWAPPNPPAAAGELRMVLILWLVLSTSPELNLMMSLQPRIRQIACTSLCPEGTGFPFGSCLSSGHPFSHSYMILLQ